ncbi:MAG: cupin domain-containing protein [Actinobacteria bacterium]|nr:cupin domain-containing protein [Actinomycetota bacterium]
MADVTVKKVDAMESIFGGSFVRARGELGVTSFGMQVLNMPPNGQDYPEHSHDGVMADDKQEEIYIPLSGSATLKVGEETWELAPGTMARVGASAVRKVLPGPDGCQMLCLGGRPGHAYEIHPFTEVGGPVPGA